MREQIKLSDLEIENVFDELMIGLTVDDLTFTREAISDWIASAENYNEYSSIQKKQALGFSCLIIENAQIKKGTQRADIVVVDFGEVRAVYF